MKRWLAFSVFIVALLAHPAAAQTAGEFAPEACPVPVPAGTVVDCGYLTVPERHANPDGPTMDLAVAILRASDPNPRPDPVLYLEGGPGGSALSGLDGWIGLPITRARDLILFDQRGTGYSDPALFCDVYEYDFDPEEASTLEYDAACAEALTADGIDLGAYNSAETAQDVKMLVLALGYRQVNLYGISYGTRVGLTVMRDVPEIARAVVLDSTYPPQINGYEMQAVNGYSAIDALLTACASDAACGSAFPNLAARFYDWVETDALVTVDFGDGDEDIDTYDAVSDLFEILYDTAAIPFVPLALENLMDGDGTLFSDLFSGAYLDDAAEAEYSDPLYDLADDLAMEDLGIDDYDEYYEYFDTLTDDELLDMYDSALSNASDDDYTEIVRLYFGFDTTAEAQATLDDADDEFYDQIFYDIVDYLVFGEADFSDSDATFNSVTCIEELPFESLEKAEQMTAHLRPTMRDGLMDGVYDQYDSCSVWGVEPAGAVENAVVRSDLPTLVLSGQFDPITPPVFNQAAMEGLTRAQLVTIPGGGHGEIDAGDCPAAIGIAFLDNPTAPLDTSCVASMRVRWVTEQ